MASRINTHLRKGRHAAWACSALAMAAALTACSGSSSSQDPAPTVNSPPTLGRDRDVVVQENTTNVVEVRGSDADGDTLTYAITGGDDAALFEIDTAVGDLRFLEAPDFEEPADANADNIYVVVISVSDGNGGEDSAVFQVSVLDAPDTRYVDQVFAETTTTDDIVYATTDGVDYAINIVTPVGDTEVDRPVMLLATGGGFALTVPELSLPLARIFAERGYVTAVMDYRTLGRDPEGEQEVAAGATDATHDMFAAVRFLRAHADEYGIDPGRIIVGGTSAGATMAVTAATIDPGDALPQSFADYMADNGGVYGNIGDHLDQSPIVQGAFPLSGFIFDLFMIDEGSSPIYGAHEELDPRAPCYTVPLGTTQLVISGTCDFIPYLEATGVPAQAFIVLGDDGHVDFSDEEYEQIFAEAAQFFFENVVNAE